MFTDFINSSFRITITVENLAKKSYEMRIKFINIVHHLPKSIVSPVLNS